MNRLLLTSICKPIGPRYGDALSVGYELLHGQVTLAQGIFSPRATHLQYGLEFIAANLETPSTVLHYPSKKELIAELKKKYEFVGISFILSTFHRMKEVVALVREHSPQTKIILGGYGTVIEDELLKPYGDYFCRTEGVGFMKEILGEKPLQGTYQHPLIVSKLRVLSTPVSNTGLVFAGLGCPNGCDFCCTSHFFRRRHIRLLPTGEDIFRVVEGFQDLEEGMKITVLDEDFLLNAKRAREFSAAVRRSGKPLSIFCFASLKALSQFQPEELVEMGIDGLWIGFEGRRSGYAKLGNQDVPKIFSELRRAGILVLASMIIGFDYQTPEIIQEELDYLIAQKPTLSQILIYGPTPGTPFYERIMSEKRLRPDFAKDREQYFHQCTGFDAMVTHPSISSQDLPQIQQHCFRKEYQKLGPSIVRSLESYWRGYLRWRESEKPILRKKAEVFRRDFIRGIPLLPLAGLLGPSREARQFARQLLYQACRETGVPWIKTIVLAALAFPAAFWTKTKMTLDLFQHPRLRRSCYAGQNLESLCGLFQGKKPFRRLDIQLNFLKPAQWAQSLRVLHFHGTLDISLYRQFRKKINSLQLPTIEPFAIDLRTLEVLNTKVFTRLLKKLQGESRRISLLLSENQKHLLGKRFRAFKQKIDVYFDEMSFLSAMATPQTQVATA